MSHERAAAEALLDMLRVNGAVLEIEGLRGYRREHDASNEEAGSSLKAFKSFCASLLRVPKSEAFRDRSFHNLKKNPVLS